MRARGQTLLEAVIASFILVFVFLVVIQLFHGGLRYSRQAESQQMAELLLDRQMERLKAWSETPAASGYNFDRLKSLYDGDVSTLEDYPEYRIQLKVRDHPLYSLCSALETDLESKGLLARKVSQGARVVDATILWGQQKAQLTALFSAPVGKLNNSQPPLRIQPASLTSSLPQDGSATFQVTATDEWGRPLPDLFFAWDLMPLSGDATLEVSRDGRQATLSHYILKADNSRFYRSGSVMLKVSVRLKGVWRSATTEALNLQ